MEERRRRRATRPKPCSLASDRPPRSIAFQRIEAGFRAPKSSFRTVPTPSQADAQWLLSGLSLRYRCGGSAGIQPASQFSAKHIQGGTSNKPNRTQVLEYQGAESDTISTEGDSKIPPVAAAFGGRSALFKSTVALSRTIILWLCARLRRPGDFPPWWPDRGRRYWRPVSLVR